jgi:hypothetical protein
MGLKVFELNGREAAAFECDDPRHGGEAETAWFSAGSLNDNVMLARAAGWVLRHDSRWACAACAGKRLRKAA